MPTVTLQLDYKYDSPYDVLLSLMHEYWHMEEYLEAHVDFELIKDGTAVKVWLDRRFLELAGTELSIFEGDSEHRIYLRRLANGGIVAEEV
jgi:hypothetical protein